MNVALLQIAEKPAIIYLIYLYEKQKNIENYGDYFQKYEEDEKIQVKIKIAMEIIKKDEYFDENNFLDHVYSFIKVIFEFWNF
ncbi:unnamed protein product [Meloidogyne enterolobii]